MLKDYDEFANQIQEAYKKVEVASDILWIVSEKRIDCEIAICENKNELIRNKVIEGTNVAEREANLNGLLSSRLNLLDQLEKEERSTKHSLQSTQNRVDELKMLLRIAELMK